MKERFRKFLVALKRKPHIIPLTVLGIAFLIYSLKLTVISNTTAKIQGPGMGLFGFITMLFSLLGLVSFGRSFPHRKPVNKLMLCVMTILFAGVIWADIRYMGLVQNALYREKDSIRVTESTAYILQALTLLKAHICIVATGLGLTALLPLYRPLIRKIRTSVNVEDYGRMETIDISGEDE